MEAEEASRQIDQGSRQNQRHSAAPSISDHINARRSQASPGCTAGLPANGQNQTRPRGIIKPNGMDQLAEHGGLPAEVRKRAWSTVLEAAVESPQPAAAAPAAASPAPSEDASAASPAAATPAEASSRRDARRGLSERLREGIQHVHADQEQ